MSRSISWVERFGHGNVEFRRTIKEFKGHTRDSTRQKGIFISAEHQGKLSGPVNWGGRLEIEESEWLQFSCSAMSNSLQPHGQHARPPCPPPTLGACPNSCPLSQWCYPTISSSLLHFSSCPLSFPASGSFPMSILCIRWPKYWSFSFSISPSNEYSGLVSFRMDWLDLLAVQGTLKRLLQHHSSEWFRKGFVGWRGRW